MPFEDSSVGHTEDHTPTITGATIDTDIYKYGGGSGHFRGDLYQHVTYPDSADWNLGASDFTISAWIYVDGVNQEHYISQLVDSKNYQVIHFVKTRIEFYAKGGGGGVVYIYKDFGVTPLSDGWHHIEIGRDQSVSGYVFVDGIKQTLTTNSYSNTCGDYNAVLDFGHYSTQWSGGNIDVFKIDKGICRHNANFTSPADEDVDNDEYTVLLLKMNGTPVPPIKINIGDAWKEGTPYINIGDEWKEVTSLKINIGDEWKDVF